MTRRLACLVLSGPRSSPAAPPGVDGSALAAAMAEDVYAVLTDLNSVAPVIVYRPEWADLARSVAWAGTELLAVPERSSLVAALGRYGPAEAVLVAADAPDLPALHLATVFRTLAGADVVAAPALVRTGAVDSPVAIGTGLVLLGLRLPAPTGFEAGLDRSPPAGALPGPPWPRVRTAADLAALDPGLEGWEATRQLLH